MARVISCDAVDLLKVDGHREDEDGQRVINLLGATARHEVLDVEKDVHARADLAAALLDELADVLPERPSVREEEVKARRRLEPRQVHELLFVHGWQFYKAAPTVAEPAELLLRAD
eukprot:7379793-Prymnesium_polylepis.1